MSMMKRLLEESVPVRWKVFPTPNLDPGFRLMENIEDLKGNLWIERERGTWWAMKTLEFQYNKEGYITPASKQDATNRAAHGVMSKWNSTLELAKCTIAKK